MAARGDGDRLTHPVPTTSTAPRPLTPTGATSVAATAPRVTAGLLGLLATALAAIGSWSVSLWSDEAATISAASRDPDELWRLLGNIDAVHGAYYAVMHVWVGLFGASPFSVRLPSAVAVGVAAAGVYLLARRLDPRAAVWAAIIFALLPRVTWAGIEARPFALSIALAVWLTVMLHRAVTQGPRWLFAVYAVLLALATAVNLYVALIAAAHGVTLMLRPRLRRALPAFVAAALGGALLVAPLLRVALGQSGQLGGRDRGLLGVARNVAVNQWFLGETPTATTASAATLQVDGSGMVWKVAAVGLALVCWVLIARALATASAGRASSRADLLAWTVPWLVVPTVVVLLATLGSPTLYNARYFGFCAPAVAILVAVGATSLPRRSAAAVSVVLVLLVVPVYQSQRTLPAKSGADWSRVAALLDGRTEVGDGVYFGPRDDPRDGTVLRSLRTVSIAYPEPFDGLADVTLLADPAEGATLFGTSGTLDAHVDRLEALDTLWVLRRQDRPDDAVAEDALLRDAGFTVVEEWDYPQTEVLQLTRS